jgi:hypothetical protein
MTCPRYEDPLIGVNFKEPELGEPPASIDDHEYPSPPRFQRLKSADVAKLPPCTRFVFCPCAAGTMRRTAMAARTLRSHRGSA